MIPNSAEPTGLTIVYQRLVAVSSQDLSRLDVLGKLATTASRLGSYVLRSNCYCVVDGNNYEQYGACHFFRPRFLYDVDRLGFGLFYFYPLPCRLWRVSPHILRWKTQKRRLRYRTTGMLLCYCTGVDTQTSFLPS